MWEVVAVVERRLEEMSLVDVDRIVEKELERW
jgi:hypothetical protein